MVCEAEVVDVKSAKAFDKTHLLTIKVPNEYVMKTRFYKRINAPEGTTPLTLA